MFNRLFSLGRSGKGVVDTNQSDIDADDNYCPKCGEEYRAEIETCAHCSVPLIPGSEKLVLLRQQEAGLHSHSMEISADDELVTLQTGKLMDLKALQQLLKKEYISSMLAGGDTSKG